MMTMLFGLMDYLSLPAELTGHYLVHLYVAIIVAVNNHNRQPFVGVLY